MEKKNTLKYLILISLTLIIGVGCFLGYHVYHLFFAQPFHISESKYLYIDTDDTVDSVYCKIQLTGNTEDIDGFKFLSLHKNYAERIKTGRYEIKPTDNNRYLFNRLFLGYQTPIKFTLPNVRGIDKVISHAAQKLMLDSVSLSKLLTDSTYFTQIGFSKQTLPAVFIPNTYEVYWDMTAEKFMERMLKEYKKFWNDKRLQQAQAIGLSPIEVATLASIVDEETANNAEKPMVAGLYINRLHKGMLLQADPTVKFAHQEFGLRRILFKHLEIDSPYNTYKYAGLPPGPIRIPSIQGLESVLNYSKHNYIFMCAKEDFSGTHNFAVTSAQHAANARKYQQALNRLKIR